MVKLSPALLGLGLAMLGGCGGGGGSSGSSSSSDPDSSGSSYYQDGGTATLSGKTYAATGSDENAVEVLDSGTLVLSNSTITKSGDTSSEETSDFTGCNAAVLASIATSESDPASATTGSTITLTDCTISTAAAGANAVVRLWQRPPRSRWTA